MDIYNWLEIDESSYENNTKVKELLTLYIQGFHEIYSIEMTTTIQEYLSKVKGLEKSKSNDLFITWISTIGYIEICNALKNFKELTAKQTYLIDFRIKAYKDNLKLFDNTTFKQKPYLINALTGLSKDLKILIKS